MSALMPNVFFIIVTLSLSFFSYASNNITTVMQNEQACMKNLELLIVNQQIIYSDSTLALQERQIAERTIDITRDAFNQKESYCDAQQAMEAYIPEKDKGLRLHKGQNNYFGRNQHK
ncbi:hypothetical protein PBPRB0523 [Photobacterium profundum SS9]|uniref:Uncharacterized protein n=2 Tax=Photobacterium profundum TaxID=74109 RepID=Q6LJY4_PHOPR|nr:hypothetical protein PBPRB0523 [Photobacterium profundum SS9]